MESPTFEIVHKMLEDAARHEDASEHSSPHPKRLSIRLWHEFDKITFPETEWWITDLIPASCIALIAAPSGEKKSWTALEMARCIALGIPFAGHFETRKANVLYIEQESPQYLVQQRGRMLGISTIDSGIYFCSQDALCLNDPAIVDELFSFVQEHDIKVVFVDTLRSVAGGIKEEKAEEVRAFFQRFKKWKDQGVTVVVLDHCRKPQRFENAQPPKKEQVLSSQDKVAAVEIVHMLRSQERSKEIFFYTVKSKINKEVDPFKLLLAFEKLDGSETATLTYGGIIEEKKLKSDEAKHLIAAYLRETGDKKMAKDIQDALEGDAGKTAIEDALKDMRNDGSVCSEKDGRAYRYWLPPDDQSDDDLPNENLGSLL